MPIIKNTGIPEVPPHLDVTTRLFLTQLRNAVLHLQNGRQPVQPPTNLRVTPIAYGNVIDYTRSNADSYTLWWSLSAEFPSAQPIPIGQSARYSHNLAKDGVKVWYWLQATKGGVASALVGPKTGATLTSNTATTLPAQQPASSVPAADTSRGNTTIPGGVQGGYL